MNALSAGIATLVLAGSATAATMTVDTDRRFYDVGDTVTITATLTTDGTEPPDNRFGSAVLLQVAWHDDRAFVANGDPPGDFGFSTQIVTAGPNAGAPGNEGSSLSSLDGIVDWVGPRNSRCSTEALAGQMCILVNQSLFVPIGPDAQTLVSTLVLQTFGEELGAFRLWVARARFFGNGIDDVVIGSNFAGATIVPEPTTGGLLALGLVGQGLASRRTGRRFGATAVQKR